MITSPSEENTAQSRWEGEGGNSRELQTSAASEELAIPILVSTEQAVSWGSHLSADQYTVLVEKQRALSRVALTEGNLQRMVNLATQSQLLREAAEAFVPTPAEPADHIPSALNRSNKNDARFRNWCRVSRDASD